ncbi:PaaX family transcriptional regulator C-terminal domain-containing protein [Streptomyces sp. NPDC056160]|uniref:PaaX family transcriptional regulator C-terminal domain-containing protein n=1 Tax=Streptomyces sp. NPDC056160 TaxID=3345731 RepID=UPI0035E04713
MNDSREPAALDLRPLSARSVVLSLLLGTHPPELPVKDLLRAVEPFGVGGSTLRAALSRMVAAGDLWRTDGVHGLSDRLLERQRRQDDAVHPRTRTWDGEWEMAVVTATGRGPAERAGLRARLTALRLAELREGLWLRPANLRRARPAGLGGVVHFAARPDEDARDLAADLWPLDAWAATGRALLTHLARTDGPAGRFTALAAVVRHLLDDPVLPAVLLPAGWPGPELRAAYTARQRELTEEVLGRTGRRTRPRTAPRPGQPQVTSDAE